MSFAPARDATSRAVFVDRFGAPEVLRLQPSPRPEPADGQVLIAVNFAGVAFADLLMRAGTYPGGPKPRYVPGWDVLGIVEAVGEGVDPELVGQTVLALVFEGGYASHALAAAERTVLLPQGIHQRSAACLTLNYAAAWQMLRRVGHAKPAEAVLVHAAGGGVGSAVLDLARALGLRAYGVASRAKAVTVAGFGATYLGDEAAVASAAAANRGFDIIFDPTGGAETWRAMRLLAPGGRLVCYGFTALVGRMPLAPCVAFHLLALKIRSALADSKKAVFFRLSAAARRDPTAFREDLAMLIDWLAEGRITPRIDSVLPLAHAQEAHRRLAERHVQGKLLLDARA